MNVKYLYDAVGPRAQVWCVSDELTAEQDGSYTFKETPSKQIGTGSEIIVMDVPGLLLFYDADREKAYNWGAGE